MFYVQALIHSGARGLGPRGPGPVVRAPWSGPPANGLIWDVPTAKPPSFAVGTSPLCAFALIGDVPTAKPHSFAIEWLNKAKQSKARQSKARQSKAKQS